MPTAVIAEDEPLLAETLADRLRVAWPELELLGIAHDGDSAIALIERVRPQVAFLDIRMPGRSGLEVAATLAVSRHVPATAIVFVTAYDEYALQAFDAEAIDYLVKPVRDERLAACVARLRARLADPGGDAGSGATPAALQRLMAQLHEQLASFGRQPAAGAHLRFLRASVGEVTRQIPVDEVLYFEAHDKYVSVVTRDATALVRIPLSELLAHLDPQRFAQIHRSTIVNLDAIDTIRRDLAGRSFVHLRGQVQGRPVKLAVSRQFGGQFRGM